MAPTWGAPAGRRRPGPGQRGQKRVPHDLTRARWGAVPRGSDACWWGRATPPLQGETPPPARKVPAEVEPQRGAHWAACGSPLPLRGLVATLTEKPDSSPGPPPCSRSTPERGSHGGSGPVEVGPWRTPRGAGGGLGSTGQRASSRVLEVRALPQTRCPQWNRVTRHDGNVGMWCTPARAKAKWVPQGPRAPHIQSTQSQSHGWRSIRLSRRHAQDARPDSSSEASRGLLGSTVRGPPTSGL